MYPQYIEWAKQSDTNVCYLTYAYEEIRYGLYNLIAMASEMVQNHRLQYAAKVARDFVLSIREECIKNGSPGCLSKMSKLTVLGLSFGAHVASQTCKNLYQSTGEKVGKLIGEQLF